MNDYWTPDNRWDGKDVFVLGGGPSLKDFDFDRLSGLTVIGCNEAYRLGYPLVQAILFSDGKWFVRSNRELERYANDGGLLVTHEEHLRYHNFLWLKVLRRKDDGLHRNGIGFGKNSGSGAINLALLLGARRVYLLGFDCKSEQGQNNWHPYYKPYHRPGFVPPYHHFKEGMKRIAQTLKVVYPSSEIINITPDSALFEIDEHTKQRKYIFPMKNINEVLPLLVKIS